MKVLIVDNRIPEGCERYLIKEGFSLLKLPADPTLGSAVASHPDTVLFHFGNEMVTTADYCDVAAYIFSDIREYRPDVKIGFTADVRSEKYPYDCIFNALVIGKYLFCKSDTISDGVRMIAERQGLEIVHTNQGYPACSVLHFGNAAITADLGLGELLKRYGVKVTMIRQGSISLPPYQYGFIGGASGVVGHKVYFFGNLNTHPDAEKIRKAIEDEGYLAISMDEGELRDLGGIIAL